MSRTRREPSDPRAHPEATPQEPTAHPDAATDRPDTTAPGRKITGAQAFFAVVTLIMCGYSLLAFDLAWGTEAGRIGPGFFPRIIGILGTLLALIALIKHMRRPSGAKSDHEAVSDEEHTSHHPFLMAVIAAALTMFVTFFIPVGAPVTAALFLLLLYFLIDRRHYMRRVVLSLVFPVLLYFLFDVWLGAGLPEGITFFI